MIGFLAIAIAAAAGIWGHVTSRKYVRNRLRFVDGIHNPVVPIVAGIGAALVATPVAWLLPIVGSGTIVLFGLGVGTGVLAGQRDTKSLPGS